MFKWVRKPSFVLKFLLQILQDRTLVFASDLEEEQEDGWLSGFMTTLFCLFKTAKEKPCPFVHRLVSWPSSQGPLEAVGL